MLLLTVIPARATNNDMPQGSSVDLAFSPSRIPLGYSSTFSITASAEHVGTDLYVLVMINFQGWLRWQTSDIKMGNFLYGGVVLKSVDQNFNSDFLQIGVVVPRGDSKTVQVPVTPTRAGIFYLNEVQVVTLPIANGDYIRAQDGVTLLGLTASILQFPSHLEVYDPTLKQIADNQKQILDNQQRTLDNQNQTFNLLQSGFYALEAGVQNGFNGISNQSATLLGQQKTELQLIESQYHYMTNAFYALFGVSILILFYLFWFTYRLSKRIR